MTVSHGTRRRFLGAVSVGLLGGVAGCQIDVSIGDSTPTPEPYDALQHERVYVARSLSLTPPEGVYEASAPEEADVIVLPASHDRAQGLLVEWLRAGKHVALVGSSAESSYHELKESRLYANTYGQPQGRSKSCAASGGSGGDGATPTECEPPELLVAWEVDGERVTSYRRTWGGTDEPTATQVFQGIEAAFDDGT